MNGPAVCDFLAADIQCQVMLHEILLRRGKMGEREAEEESTWMARGLRINKGKWKAGLKLMAYLFVFGAADET